MFTLEASWSLSVAPMGAEHRSGQRLAQGPLFRTASVAIACLVIVVLSDSAQSLEETVAHVAVGADGRSTGRPTERDDAEHGGDASSAPDAHLVSEDLLMQSRRLSESRRPLAAAKSLIAAIDAGAAHAGDVSPLLDMSELMLACARPMGAASAAIEALHVLALEPVDIATLRDALQASPSVAAREGDDVDSVIEAAGNAARGALQEVGPERSSPVVAAFGALATALQHLGHFDGGMRFAAAASHLPPAKAPGVHAVLSFLHSSMLECSGDDVAALQGWEEAMRAARSAAGHETGGPPISFASYAKRDPLAVVRHIELLRRVVAHESPPPDVAEALVDTEEDEVAVLLEQGPWESRGQLPQEYVPGLTARPWHDVDGWPGVRRVAEVLHEATESLADEWSKLDSSGVMEPSTECIVREGLWLRFSANAPWRPAVDAQMEAVNGGAAEDTAIAPCAADEAPVACDVMTRASSIGGIKVLRAGYSQFSAGTSLKPHFGTTNAQLKLHLSLVVPEAGCASLTVLGGKYCCASQFSMYACRLLGRAVAREPCTRADTFI